VSSPGIAVRKDGVASLAYDPAIPLFGARALLSGITGSAR